MATLNPIRLRDLKLQCKLVHKATQNPNLELKDPELKAILSLAISGFAEDHSKSKFRKPKLKEFHQLFSEYYGFANWAQLKQFIIDNDYLYRLWAPIFVFKWFKSYKPAYQYHKAHGGYLLRFWGDYVICGQEYINRLELDGFEDSWKAIQYNAIEPNDLKVWDKIKKEAVNNYLLINK